MSRHPATPTSSVPVTGDMKRRTAKGARKRKAAPTPRGRASSAGKPWTPSMGIYADLKIPITVVGRKP